MIGVELQDERQFEDRTRWIVRVAPPPGSPVLLRRLLNGLSVASALEGQLAVLEPNELEDRDLPRLSELTFFVLLVAVLLQSATQKQPISTTFLL